MNRQTIIFFIIFVLDALALSWMLAAWRSFWVTRGTLELARFGLTTAWFFLLFAALGYFTYLGEKKKGKVTRKIALYEWFDAHGWRFE